MEFIDKEHLYYQENEWDENNVAVVNSSQDEVIISVSEENRNLTKLVARAQRKNDTAVQDIKNKYLEHISFYAFILDKNRPDVILSKEDEQIPEESYQKLKEYELMNASETVCGMISDFFEMIITENVNEYSEI